MLRPELPPTLSGWLPLRELKNPIALCWCDDDIYVRLKVDVDWRIGIGILPNPFTAFCMTIDLPQGVSPGLRVGVRGVVGDSSWDVPTLKYLGMGVTQDMWHHAW